MRGVGQIDESLQSFSSLFTGIVIERPGFIKNFVADSQRLQSDPSSCQHVSRCLWSLGLALKHFCPYFECKEHTKSKTRQELGKNKEEKQKRDNVLTSFKSTTVLITKSGHKTWRMIESFAALILSLSFIFCHQLQFFADFSWKYRSSIWGGKCRKGLQKCPWLLLFVHFDIQKTSNLLIYPIPQLLPFQFELAAYPRRCLLGLVPNARYVTKPSQNTLAPNVP